MNVYTAALEAQVNLARAELGIALARANIAFEEDDCMRSPINDIDECYLLYKAAMNDWRKARFPK